jgi:glycogen phosphorylase
LLDTNRPENEQHFRDLTRRVYGGDSTTRIMQECCWASAACACCAALGIAAVGLPHERRARGLSDAGIDPRKMAAGKSLPTQAQTKEQCIFTTHTPVEAGHDRFSPT